MILRRAFPIACWVLVGSAPAAAAEPAGTPGGSFAGETPAELEGIEIRDRSGASMPGDVFLVDETGGSVRVEGYLGRGRPLLVQFVYYRCPMLCSLVLNGYTAAGRELEWTPGREYEVLTVSIDPRDDSKVAAAKKASYLEALGKAEAGAGWHFLTGSEPEVRRLADSLGFGYRWVEEQGEYAHAAGMFVITPQGQVSRTLYGIEFPARDLRLSLVEAAEGRLGSPLDRLLLYCFQYDAETHTYALVARNVMKAGGALTLLSVGTLLGVYWLRERRRPRGGAADGVLGSGRPA